VAGQLYRFLVGETPDLHDFMSQGARGNIMKFHRNNPEAVRRWNDGISVYDDFERVCEIAAAAQYVNREYFASLTLPDPNPFEVSQWGHDVHHYTIFGTPAELIALVTSYGRVPGAPGE
jgi:hypothetical protein